MSLTGDYVFITIVLLAVSLTMIGLRRPHILVNMSTFFVWLGLSIMFFTGYFGTNLTETWVSILAWVFLMLAFASLLMRMDTEIRIESKGVRYTEYGQKPKLTPSKWEKYNEKVQRHLSRGGRR